jgi:hypothetical protein
MVYKTTLSSHFFFRFRAIDEQYGLEEMCTNLVRDMNEYGVCVLDNFIGEEKGMQVLEEVKSMYTAGYFKVRPCCLYQRSTRFAKSRFFFVLGWPISC